MVRYDIMLVQRVERAGEVLRSPAARPLLEVRATLSDRHSAVRCSDGGAEGVRRPRLETHEVARIAALDMFPASGHVELAVYLRRRI
jgi:hypothetical protein